MPASNRTSRARLTKRTVDAAQPPASGRAVTWDTDLSGFGLRVSCSGRKTYVLKYRVGGRQRWFTIGEHGGTWTAEQARSRAADVLRQAAMGRDLQCEKLERRSDLTVSELIEAYLSDGPATKPEKRLSTWATDRSNLVRHVGPLLGNRIARQVTAADIARMVHAVIAGKTAADVRTGPRGRAIVRGGAGTAERVLSTTGAMFAWAVKQGLADAVPSRGVRLPKRASQERFLAHFEAQHLLSTIDELDSAGRINRAHADALRMLMHTGARKSEVLGLKWSEVDLARRRLTLPPERTKAGGRTGERRISLSTAAVTLLAARDRAGEAVFPSASDPNKGTVGLQKTWKVVRDAAGFDGLRVHDLRHTFASLALAQGASLPLIGKALGHSSPRVTERYAHLADDPLDALTDRVGDALTGRSRFGTDGKGS